MFDAQGGVQCRDELGSISLVSDRQTFPRSYWEEPRGNLKLVMCFSR